MFAENCDMSRVAGEFERKWLESATCLLIFQGEFKELLIRHFRNVIVCVFN